MKRLIALSLIPFMLAQSAFAADDTFIDYQNYNHGYCPSCSYCPCKCDAQSGCEGQAPCNAPAAACAAPCEQKECSPCDPQPRDCGYKCGVPVCAIVVAIGALAAAAAILLSTNAGSSPSS